MGQPQTHGPADESNPFTRLAEAARAGREQLPADHLLPGDAVSIEDMCLMVSAVSRGRELVTLDFVDVDYSRTLPSDAAVCVVSRSAWLREHLSDL
jgi:hypothetical protein